jgi:hypothetical protein
MPIFKIPWNPFDFADQGPCLQMLVMHTEDEMRLGVGLDYPKPLPITGLLDTGAHSTIISKTFARNRKLTMTNANVKATGVGGPCFCDEYACSICFPQLPGQPVIGTAKILAGAFEKEVYSGLIGRDILKFWKVDFDGRARCVTISF